MSHVPSHIPAARLILVGLVSAVLAFALSGAAVLYGGGGTPLDEHAHFDYAYKLSQGDLPDRYALLDETSVIPFTCAGPPEVWGPTNCGEAPVAIGALPFGGVNYVTPYSPGNYVPSAVAIGISEILGRDAPQQLLTAARFGSALFVAMLAFLAAGILLLVGRSPLLAVSVAVIIASLPSVVLAGSHVTNDVSALGLVLLPAFVWLLLVRRDPRVRFACAMAAAVVAISAKETALVGLLLPVWFECSAAARAGDRDRRLPVWQGLGLLVVAAVLFQGLKVVDGLLRPFIPVSTGMTAGGVGGLRGLIASFPDWVLSSPLAYYGSPGALSTGVWNSLGVAVCVVVVGMAAGMILQRDLRFGGPPARGAAAVSVLMLGVLPLLMIIWLKAQGGSPFFQPRYLVPTLVCVAVFALASVHPRRTLLVTAFAVAIYVVAFDRALGLSRISF